MIDSVLSLLTFVVCVWILVNVGAKMPTKVQKTNKKLKRGIRNLVKSFTEDE